MDLAWLTHQDKVYFARYQSRLNEPHSAVTQLIQGLFEAKVDNSFFILRERIFTNQKELSTMDRGMVKMAAKRIALSREAPNLQNATELSFSKSRFEVEDNVIYDLPTRLGSEGEAKELVERIEKLIPRGDVLHDVNRPIVALWTDADLKPLIARVNLAGKNKTLHAEVRTIQEYYRQNKKQLPMGAQLFVTLKPCAMCAGMIQHTQSAQIKVNYFAENMD